MTFYETDHDTKTQTQGRRKECIAILYPEVLLARELANDDVDADDGCSYDACYETVSRKDRILASKFVRTYAA